MNATAAAHTIRLIDRAIEVETVWGDGRWVDDLKEHRAAAMAFLVA